MTQDLAALVAALRTQRQIDMDGCEVAVSRQACDEAADALEAQAAEIARLTAEVVRRSEMHECAMAERDDCILDWSDTKAERDRLAAETARLTAALNEADACDKGLVRLNEALQQRAEKAEADRDKWFEGAGAHHVASMREAQRADQNAARAEKAEAALSESQALLATAFEVAAQVLDTHGDGAANEALSQQLCCSGQMCGCQGADVGLFLQYLIRALTPADAQAALDARINAAREEGRIAGLREAAELIAGEDHTREELKRGRLQAPGVLARAYDAILAKIKETEK